MAQVVAPFRVQASFPTKFRPLLEEKARYKVFYGGRGGAKSWQFARALLIKGLRGGFRVLCTREIQSSLKESSKQLLSDQIKALGLQQFYRETRDEIRGPDGTLFLFKGLRDPEALKSAEGIDCVWIEEARTVSKASWQKLDPTIRKPGAEIWISFNPELETDYLYTLFVSGSPPPSSIVQHVTFKDNPWIDAEFVRQAEYLKATDYDEYLWVYEGATRVALDGAIYANELRLAKSEGRITRVPLDKSKPIHVFCDLGRGDATAMWFVQIIGLQYRIVGYYENRGVGWDHYLTYLENERQDRGWFYGTIWLPHDGDNHTLGARRTIKEQTLDAGYRAKIVKKLPISEGINAARAIFPMCWFDEEGTQRGRQCLGQYHYEIDDDGTPSKLPEHDWCLTGDTLVLTRYGNRPISELPYHGEALTTCGWRPYHSPRITRRNAPLVAVEFVDGLTVRCTPDHMFWTESGWKFAADLQKDSAILSTLTPSPNISTAAFTGCGRASAIFHAVENACTVAFGPLLSVLFRQGATSTTEMVTYSTTTSKTSNACRPASIYPSVVRDPFSARKREKALRNGMRRQKGVFGILGNLFAPKDGQNGSARIGPATIAALSSMLWSEKAEIHSVSVPRNAKWLLIASVNPLPEREDVWCITVPGEHHYSLSNGAVVHNSSHGSDGFRYMGVALREDAPKPKMQPRVRPAAPKGRHGWLGR